MARVKKQDVLTLEERLEQALVSDWEQPYKVPENWVWTKVGIINQYEGQSINPALTPDKMFELYSVPSCEIGFPEIISGNEIGSTKQSVKKNDVLLCKINPRINRVWIISQHTEHTLLASSEWIVVRNSSFNARYLMWLFQCQYFRELMLSNVSGVGGSLMRAQPKWVKEYAIPIPPFAEQQRIVDRIEGLFAKLDEAKEKAQAALDSFETRKAAILHKAFTGELTAKWREEHGVGIESWKDTNIGKLAVLITKGASPKWQGIEYTDERTQTLFVTSENVREGYLDLSKEKYLDNRINEIQKRSVLKYGDVLLNIVGASIGRAAIFNLHQLANTNQAVCIVRLNINVNREFICYYFNSPVALQYYSQKKVDVARANISLGDVKDMAIKLPYIKEQQEIVRILDDLFAKEQQAKDACTEMLSRINLIKKSILARAFRGELGTNDPTEESAVELLKQCFAHGAND